MLVLVLVVGLGQVRSGIISARTLTLTFILDTLTHLLVQAGEQCVQYKGKCQGSVSRALFNTLYLPKHHGPSSTTLYTYTLKFLQSHNQVRVTGRCLCLCQCARMNKQQTHFHHYIDKLTVKIGQCSRLVFVVARATSISPRAPDTYFRTRTNISYTIPPHAHTYIYLSIQP